MASNYELGYDDERFETIVNRNFHCLICFNVLKDPVMCRRNQHYFCRGCITQQLRTNSRTCPTCADELSVDTLNDVPRIVKDYLDELSIRCDYYDRGCRELVQLQNLKKHVAECGFKQVICGNEGCGETVSRRDRTYHESEQCEFRKLKCHNCGEISTMIAVMETNVAKISTKMENTETKMKNINRNTGDLKTRMKNMNTNINTKITNMDTEIANTNTKLEKLNTKMKNMDTNMTNLQTNVEAKFEAVNNEVRGMKASLTEVKDGFDKLREAVLDKMESKDRNQEEITRDDSTTASGDRGKQHIFVAGGFLENSVEIFNYRQRLWSLLTSMPKERWNASSFVYNNHVTVAGGSCPVVVNDMIRINIHPTPDLSSDWSYFAALQLPARMCGHSSVVCKDSLFVTGGFNDDQRVHSNCIHEVRLKPPYTVKLVVKMPEPRANHSTILFDDSILIIGGSKTGDCEDSLSSVLSYDIQKNECRQLPPLPYPVSEMATVKWGENVVIIGGIDKGGKALNSVVIYNVKTGISHMLPPIVRKRKGCMAVVIENTIVVLGGRNERGNYLKSVEGFSFDRYTWENLPDMNRGRSYATAVVI